MGWGRVLSEGGLMKSGKIAVALQSLKNPNYLTFTPRASEGRIPLAHLWQDSIQGGSRLLMLIPSSPDQFSLEAGEIPKR